METENTQLETNRAQLGSKDFNDVFRMLEEKIEFRVNQKGLHSYGSVHEILGILTEEMTEFTAEVHQNSNAKYKVEELLDIAVAAVWGIASITSDGIDW